MCAHAASGCIVPRVVPVQWVAPSPHVCLRLFADGGGCVLLYLIVGVWYCFLLGMVDVRSNHGRRLVDSVLVAESWVAYLAHRRGRRVRWCPVLVVVALPFRARTWTRHRLSCLLVWHCCMWRDGFP